MQKSAACAAECRGAAPAARFEIAGLRRFAVVISCSRSAESRSFSELHTVCLYLPALLSSWIAFSVVENTQPIIGIDRAAQNRRSRKDVLAGSSLGRSFDAGVLIRNDA